MSAAVVALFQTESEPPQAAPPLPFDFPAGGEVDLADPMVRRIIHEGYGAVDFWTRAPLPLAEMHLDHVLPRLLGGPDNVFNLVPTSAAVNTGKSDTFDAVAFVPVLAIIRAVYAPRIMAALARDRRRSQTLLSRQGRHETKRTDCTAQLGIRIPPTLREALDRRAADDHRSVASLVEKILADAAKEAGYLPKPEADG